MYLNRITLNPQSDHQQLAKVLSEDSYREHQILWTLFGGEPDKERDFLYRRVFEHGRIKYYILSERIPVDKSGVWQVDPPKVYKPKLSRDQNLYFMLRVNPVITLTAPDGKKRRHDIVMHQKTLIDYKQMPKQERPSIQQIVQKSCIEWLSVRADKNGFTFKTNEVIADGYRQHHSRSKKSNKYIRYSTVDFQGLLTITDPERFKLALFNGIGKSKAFGCGLILIRRT